MIEFQMKYLEITTYAKTPMTYYQTPMDNVPKAPIFWYVGIKLS